MRASVSPRQSPTPWILASISCEGESPSPASLAPLFAFVMVGILSFGHAARRLPARRDAAPGPLVVAPTASVSLSMSAVRAVMPPDVGFKDSRVGELHHCKYPGNHMLVRRNHERTSRISRPTFDGLTHRRNRCRRRVWVLRTGGAFRGFAA